MRKCMKHPWFKKWGFIYRPISWTGALITFILILFLIKVFTVVDQGSGSTKNTFYSLFPYYLPTFLFYVWLGDKTSE